MAKKKEERALTTPISAQVPAFLKESSKGRGKENIAKEDLILPRIKLLQPLSPEVTEKGHKKGTLVNTITGKNYGDTIVFTPVNHFKSRIYWQDREDGGGILCSADNALNPRTTELAEICTNCSKGKWNNEAERDKDKIPQCTIYYNFAILIEGDGVPVALSMERTKIKVAKKLLSLAAYSGSSLDMFAKKYKLGVIEEKNNKGTWYNYTIEPVGFVNETEFKNAESFYESLKGSTVKVDTERPDEEE